MKTFNSISLLAIFPFLLATSFSYSNPPSQSERFAVLNAMLNSYIQSSQLELAKTSPVIHVREIAVYAHNLLATGGDTQKAVNAMSIVFDEQFMDTSLPYYGNFPWWLNEGYTDENSVSFTMIELAAAIIRYGDRIGTDYINSITNNLAAAAQCMMERDLPITYTNIYMLNMGSLLMLGEILESQTVTDYAEDMLDEWVDYTHLKGISEYVSPTYTAVQLTGVSFAHNNIKNASIKAKLRMVLDFIWKDVAANSFRGQGSYGPTWSRASNFIGASGGGIDWLLYMEGLRDTPSHDVTFATGSRYFVNFLNGGYRPALEIVESANVYPRTIKQIWEYPTYNSYDRDRFNYVTADFSISNSNGFYSPYDKQLAIHLASNKDMAAISVIPEFWNDAYGKTKLSSTGRPIHLRNDASYVQKDGTILALLDITSYETNNNFEYINTHILFPLNADEIWFNSQQLSGSFEVVGENQGTLYVLEGNSAVGVKIFHATGLYDYEPTYEASSDGSRWNAGRMTAIQYRGEFKPFNNTMDARVGILMAAVRVENYQEFESFKTSFSNANIAHSLSSGGIWSAATLFGGNLLEASLDMNTGLALNRNVNQTPYTFEGFSINEDLILMEYEEIDTGNGFKYGQGEIVLYEHNFDGQNTDWYFDEDIIVENGALQNSSTVNRRAVFDIDQVLGNNINLKNGSINVYARVKFGGTSSIDRVGVFLESAASESVAAYAGAILGNDSSVSRIGTFKNDSSNTVVDPKSLNGRAYLGVNTAEYEDYKITLIPSGETKLAITLYRDSSSTGEWSEVNSVEVPSSSAYNYYDENLLGATTFGSLVLNFQSPDEQIMSVAFSQQWNENFYCGDYNNDGFVNLLDFALIDSITLMQNTQQLLTILAQNWLDYCF